MTIINVPCKNCGDEVAVNSYRKYVVCPHCKSRMTFPGFTYRHIDWNSGMYANAKMWMDCPACRNPNMYLGPSAIKWRCPDCHYTVSRLRRRIAVFWFCDYCDAFLNIQEGFTAKKSSWICTACGCANETTKENIFGG